MDKNAAIEYFQATGGFLRTLASALYKELVPEQIDALNAANLGGLADAVDDTDMADGLRELGRYLARGGANVRQDLAVDYARIFLAAGIQDGKAAIPYESVFTSPEGLLMQDSRDDVAKAYRSQGLEIDHSLNDIEDHITFELEFVANMCDKTAAALGTGEELGGEQVQELLHVQVEFVDRHLLNWIDGLAQRVDKFAELAFYPAIMKVVKGALVEHRAVLVGLIA